VVWSGLSLLNGREEDLASMSYQELHNLQSKHLALCQQLPHKLQEQRNGAEDDLQVLARNNSWGLSLQVVSH
jgi:hypothetical protein